MADASKVKGWFGGAAGTAPPVSSGAGPWLRRVHLDTTLVAPQSPLSFVRRVLAGLTDHALKESRDFRKTWQQGKGNRDPGLLSS